MMRTEDTQETSLYQALSESELWRHEPSLMSTDPSMSEPSRTLPYQVDTSHTNPHESLVPIIKSFLGMLPTPDGSVVTMLQESEDLVQITMSQDSSEPDNLRTLLSMTMEPISV